MTPSRNQGEQPQQASCAICFQPATHVQIAAQDPDVIDPGERYSVKARLVLESILFAIVDLPPALGKLRLLLAIACVGVLGDDAGLCGHVVLPPPDSPFVRGVNRLSVTGKNGY